MENNTQVWGLLRRRPGSTSQRSYSMTDRQIHPLDESGVEPSRQAQFLQGSLKSGFCPQTHHVRHPNQLAPPVGFLHLPVNQARCHLPSARVMSSTTQREPLTKVSGESHRSTD